MNLAKRSLQAASYNVFASGLQAVIQFARSIILARLLLPEQFGIYAYVTSFVVISSTFAGFGIGTAIIHRAPQSEGEIARRVQFSLNVIFNVIWVIIMVFTFNWLIETKYQWMSWIILVTQVADNLTGTARTKLIREVAFGRIAFLDILNTIFGSGIAILLAWKGFGIWCLVSTDITMAVISVLGLYIIRPVWRPHFGWSREIIVYLLDFGRRSLAATILLQALDRIDDIWTGAFLGKISLGFYSRAYTFATYPRKILANPLNDVAAGTYAAIKDQQKQLSQAFFRVNAFLIRTGFLFAGLLFLIIPEFIHFVIGDQWLPMLTTFRLMLLYTLLDPIKITIGNVFNAVGKPEKVVQARFWQFVVMLIGLSTLGSWFGINGVALTMDIILIFGIILLLWQVRLYVDFSIKKIFVPPFIGLLTGLSVTILLQYKIFHDSFSLISIALKILSFCLIYLGILIFLERRELKSTIKFVTLVLRKEREYF